jgi:hypothetical protein
MAQLSPYLHNESLVTYHEATCLSPLPAVSAILLEFFQRVRYSTLNSIVTWFSGRADAQKTETDTKT